MTNSESAQGSSNLMDEHGRPYHPDMELSWQTYLGNNGQQQPAEVRRAYIAAWYAAHAYAAGWPDRQSSETVEQRDGPSTCRQEGHDWKVTCSDCGEVRPIPYVHLNSGGHDRDAKIYSVRDVEALLAVGEAMSRHAQKAETGALLCRYCPARFMTAWEHEIHEKEHAQKASEPRPCPIPEADGFDIQGKEIGPGIWGVGKANWHPESGDWRGLADINGSLCVVTLKVTPSSEGECHIRPHDFCSAGTCKVCVDAARYRWLQDNGVLVLDETLTGDALDIAVDAERRHALQIANSVDCTQCPHPDACEASGGCPKIEGGDGG